MFTHHSYAESSFASKKFSATTPNSSNILSIFNLNNEITASGRSHRFWKKSVGILKDSARITPVHARCSCILYI